MDSRRQQLASWRRAESVKKSTSELTNQPSCSEITEEGLLVQRRRRQSSGQKWNLSVADHRVWPEEQEPVGWQRPSKDGRQQLESWRRAEPVKKSTSEFLTNRPSCREITRAGILVQRRRRQSSGQKWNLSVADHRVTWPEEQEPVRWQRPSKDGQSRHRELGVAFWHRHWASSLLNVDTMSLLGSYRRILYRSVPPPEKNTQD